MVKGGRTHGASLLRDWFASNPDTHQTVIASKIGISPQSLGHIMKERHRPTLEQAVSIHTLCGVPPREWMNKITEGE